MFVVFCSLVLEVVRGFWRRGVRARGRKEEFVGVWVCNDECLYYFKYVVYFFMYEYMNICKCVLCVCGAGNNFLFITRRRTFVARRRRCFVFSFVFVFFFWVCLNCIWRWIEMWWCSWCNLEMLLGYWRSVVRWRLIFNFWWRSRCL